jgi:hypothetical protein
MELIENFGIELSSQEVPLQVLSSIYNVSQLSSKWISVVPLSTLKTPKQKSTFLKSTFSRLKNSSLRSVSTSQLTYY